MDASLHNGVPLQRLAHSCIASATWSCAVEAAPAPTGCRWSPCHRVMTGLALGYRCQVGKVRRSACTDELSELQVGKVQGTLEAWGRKLKWDAFVLPQDPQGAQGTHGIFKCRWHWRRGASTQCHNTSHVVQNHSCNGRHCPITRWRC